MTWTAWLTLGVVVVVIAAMVRDALEPAMALGMGVGILLVAGVLSPERALAGLASPAVAVVALLSLLVIPLHESALADHVAAGLFGRAPGPLRPPRLLRAWGSVAALSGFIANTTVVAALIPSVRRWARQNGTTPSTLLMSLSFATLLGGMCTLLGTSTNLVVHGLLVSRGDRGLGLFEMTPVALPTALVGLLFLCFLGPRLLPRRADPLDTLEHNPREYLARLRVAAVNRLPGRKVGAFRRLPGLFLVAVERHGHVLSPASPDLELEQDDVLVFAGQVASIKHLASTPGLIPEEDSPGGTLAEMEARGHLVEAVVSPSSPLVGLNIRDARIRGHYNAAVLAIHRHGERLAGRIGDIVIRPGDTFLLLAGQDFLTRHRYSKDFYLVSHAGHVQRPLNPSDWVAPSALAAVALTAGFAWLPLLHALLLGVLILLALRRLRPGEVLSNLPIPVLLTIAASVSLGNAIVDSGLANAAASLCRQIGLGMSGPGVIALAVLVTSIVTELVTNVAAVSIVFPVAMELADTSGVSPHTMAIAVALAASTSFLSPFSYHTNAMVAGPGGYKPLDFVRLGAPLKLLTLAAIVAGIAATT